MERLLRKAVSTFHSLKSLPEPSAEELALINELRSNVRAYLEKKTATTEEWQKWLDELCENILTNDPRSFLKWREIIYTMFTYGYKNEFDRIKESPYWKKWEHALKEDKTGMPIPYEYYLKSSGNLIHHAYSFYQLAEHFEIEPASANRIFEFGGGYGSFCRFLYRLGFTGNYIIYDFPVLNFLQEYFLKSIPLNLNFSHEPILKRRTVSLVNEYSGFINDPYEITDCDIFIALWSLSECPIKLLDEIFSKIKNPNYFLLSYQTDFSGIDNEAYFKGIQQRFNNYRWHHYPLQHMPDNYYLIGEQMNREAQG